MFKLKLSIHLLTLLSLLFLQGCNLDGSEQTQIDFDKDDQTQVDEEDETIDSTDKQFAELQDNIDKSEELIKLIDESKTQAEFDDYVEEYNFLKAYIIELADKADAKVGGTKNSKLVEDHFITLDAVVLKKEIDNTIIDALSKLEGILSERISKNSYSLSQEEFEGLKTLAIDKAKEYDKTGTTKDKYSSTVQHIDKIELTGEHAKLSYELEFIFEKSKNLVEEINNSKDPEAYQKEYDELKYMAYERAEKLDKIESSDSNLEKFKSLYKELDVVINVETKKDFSGKMTYDELKKLHSEKMDEYNSYYELLTEADKKGDKEAIAKYKELTDEVKKVIDEIVAKMDELTK